MGSCIRREEVHQEAGMAVLLDPRESQEKVNLRPVDGAKMLQRMAADQRERGCGGRASHQDGMTAMLHFMWSRKDHLGYWRRAIIPWPEVAPRV
jgi:hypothetical protein